jgi:hypothetical protein
MGLPDYFSAENWQQLRGQNTPPDTDRLLLSGKDFCGFPAKEAVVQWLAAQKAKTKLPAWYHAEGVFFPSALALEQCSSEATAHFKASLVAGRTLADLTGGLGVDTWAFAQIFAQVDYVEQQPLLAAMAKHNFSKLGVENIAVNCQESEIFLAQNTRPYDCIYLDPARRNEHRQKVFHLSDCQPNILAILPKLLSISPQVLLKTAPMLDIDLAVRQLQAVLPEICLQIWVVSHDNECKEVLYLISRGKASTADDIPITAVNLYKGEKQLFTFTRAEERLAEVQFSPPLTYLCEPYAAVSKAGAFKQIATAFDLHKLHPNSHLYTSAHYPDGFTGRVFRCRAVMKYDRKNIAATFPSVQANMVIRNFPDTLPDIVKKTGLKEGGQDFLFFTTVHPKEKIVIWAEKM